MEKVKLNNRMKEILQNYKVPNHVIKILQDDYNTDLNNVVQGVDAEYKEQTKELEKLKNQKSDTGKTLQDIATEQRSKNNKANKANDQSDYERQTFLKNFAASNRKV